MQNSCNIQCKDEKKSISCFFLRQILRDIAFGVASPAIGGAIGVGVSGTIGVGVSGTIDNITIATTIGGGRNIGRFCC